jgi:FMN phosphatase YigB (HAD superfamily)
MRVDRARLTTIVFDVDGTLYRQSELRRAMMFRLLHSAVFNPRDGWATFRALQAYRDAQELLRDGPVEGELAAAQMRLACERSGLAASVVAPIVARWMEQEPLPLLARFVDPALRGFLEVARERGLRLGILSDYPAASKVRAMGLEPMFDVLVSAQDSDVNCLKPQPGGLAAALRRLGADPSQALYVGDRPEVDARVARAVGVPCVIIGSRGSEDASADWTRAHDYAQLQALLFS